MYLYAGQLFRLRLLLTLLQWLFSVEKCGQYLPCCSWCSRHGPRTVIYTLALRELHLASRYPLTITNTSGQPALPIATFYRRAFKDTHVAIRLPPTAGTSACYKCMTRNLVQWRATVLVRQASYLTRRYRPPHLCLPFATVLLEQIASGIAPVWKGSTLAEVQTMPTHSGMLKRFAGCITTVGVFSVRTAGSG